MDAWQTLQNLAPTTTGDAWELFNAASSTGDITIIGDGMQLELDSTDFSVVLSVEDEVTVEIDEGDLLVEVVPTGLEVSF